MYSSDTLTYSETVSSKSSSLIPDFSRRASSSHCIYLTPMLCFSISPQTAVQMCVLPDPGFPPMKSHGLRGFVLIDGSSSAFTYRSAVALISPCVGFVTTNELKVCRSTASASPEYFSLSSASLASLQAHLLTHRIPFSSVISIQPESLHCLHLTSVIGLEEGVICPNCSFSRSMISVISCIAAHPFFRFAF